MNQDKFDKVVQVAGSLIATFIILVLGYFGFMWVMAGPL